MEQLEPPDEATWFERRSWFEARETDASAGGAGRLSEQACALMIELQAVFCAGAWAAVVILAGSIVEAQRFLAGHPEDAGTRSERAWLRDLRNRLIHEREDEPVFTVEDQWTRRREWERHARRAVAVALESLYGAPAGGRDSSGSRHGRRLGR